MTGNPYYNPSGTPSTGSAGASSPVRSEFTSIAAGFALLPTLSGNGGQAVVVNAGGSALTVTTGQLALAGNFTTTGAYNTTLAQGASVTLTLPTSNGTLATLAGTETLSNKTLSSPALGTPVSGVLTNCTGTASGLTAGNVTTNANLTGVITSVGNATSIGSQTGTGNKFVVDTSPTLVTPALGVATATSLAIGGAALGGNGFAVTGHLLLEGVTSTGATGTGNLVFSASPTLSGTTIVSHLTVEGVTSSGATGSGNIVFSASPTLTGTLTAATTSFSGHMTIEGVTSTGAQGSGAFVFATSPTLLTPVFGVATATSLAIGGATLGSNVLAVSGHLLLEGVTSTGATGTTKLVFADSPTFTTVITLPDGSTWDAAGIDGAGDAVFTGAVSDTAGNVRSVIHSGVDKTTGYTLATTDNGQYISLGASGAITIPNSTFADGNVITIFNNTSSSATITCNTTTCYAAGVDSNKGGGGTLALATRGVATVLFLSSTSCVVSGNVA